MRGRRKLWWVLGLCLWFGCSGEATQEHAHDHAHDALHGEEDHAHKAPHGGKVRTVSDHYHLELLLSREGQIDVYLLDEETRPLSAKGASGKIKLLLGEEVKTVPLVYEDTFQHLEARTEPFSQGQVVAIVEVTRGGKVYSARFEYTF